MVEEFKDLNELKEAVSQNKKSLENVTGSMDKLTETIASAINNFQTTTLNPAFRIVPPSNAADINGDGKVTPRESIEYMFAKTLQKITEKTQKNNVYLFLTVFAFLLLWAILEAYGIPVSF